MDDARWDGRDGVTQAVERTAEAIGGDIAQGEQRERDQALEGDRPVVGGERVPIL